MSTTCNQYLRLLRSHDLDETRHLVASVFCEHLLQARSGEPLDYRHAHLCTGNMSFSHMSYGADVRVTPGSLDSFYLVQLPSSGHDQQLLDGRELHSDPRYGTVHTPDETLEMNWSRDCRKLVVRFDREAFERHAASLFDHGLHKPLQFYPLMKLDHPACATWSNIARHFFSELQGSPQLFDLPLIRAQFEQTLMTALLTWQPHSLCGELESPAQRVLPRHVKLAADYMQANAEQPIKVEMLAAITGVSGRSLYSGFERFLGVSPMRYLRDLRMSRVREDLLDPSQPRSVTQIATRWGFYQLGRLALDYRRRYGEAPRETLARARS